MEMTLDTVKLVIDRSAQEGENLVYIRKNGVLIEYVIIQDIAAIAELLTSTSIENPAFKEALLLAIKKVLELELE